MKTLDINDFPTTDDEAKEYLPDFGSNEARRSVNGIYDCRRALGDSIEAALIYTLEAVMRHAPEEFRTGGQP